MTVQGDLNLIAGCCIPLLEEGMENEEKLSLSRELKSCKKWETHCQRDDDDDGIKQICMEFSNLPSHIARK